MYKYDGDGVYFLRDFIAERLTYSPHKSSALTLCPSVKELFQISPFSFTMRMRARSEKVSRYRIQVIIRIKSIRMTIRGKSPSQSQHIASHQIRPNQENIMYKKLFSLCLGGVTNSIMT